MATTQLSARELILTLIDSAAAERLTARYFVAAGELFDVDQASIRVALGRLVRDGSLKQVERGVYGLASRAGTLHRLVRNWSTVEDDLKPWEGGWIGIVCSHLGRSDKTRLRGRERALRLLGFAETHGLWVRPDNLRTSMADLRINLVDLGLDEASLTLEIAGLLPEESIDPATLWHISALEDQYRTLSQQLEESLNRLPVMDDAAAAIETLSLGREVTRAILLDPLLPDEWIDTSMRREMIDLMKIYDAQGKTFWRGLYRRYND